MEVTIVMGLAVLVSMTIMPSLAQDNPLGLPSCWAKMDACTTSAMIDTADPTSSYAICCPVIKPQAANTTCFCSIKEYLQNIPNAQPDVLLSHYELMSNKALADCKIGTTFDQMCNGVRKDDSSSGSLKDGGITIASVTLLPAVLFAWMMMIMV